jgi:hypothetical protein
MASTAARLSQFRTHASDPRLPLAACRDHPLLPPDSWFADSPSELREGAVLTCQSCPELAPCRAWSVEEVNFESGVFGGWSAEQRRTERRRREREAGAAAARRELHREPAKRAERLRRALGKAESAEDQRKRYAVYYAANAEQVNARRRARYAARRQRASAA